MNGVNETDSNTTTNERSDDNMSGMSTANSNRKEKGDAQPYKKKLLTDLGINDGCLIDKSYGGNIIITGAPDDDIDNKVFWYHEESSTLIKEDFFEKMKQQYLSVEEKFKKICENVEVQYNKNEGIPFYDTFNKTIIIMSSDFKKWLERYYQMDSEIVKLKGQCKKVCHEIDNSLCYGRYIVM